MESPRSQGFTAAAGAALVPDDFVLCCRKSMGNDEESELWR